MSKLYLSIVENQTLTPNPAGATQHLCASILFSSPPYIPRFGPNNLCKCGGFWSWAGVRKRGHSIHFPNQRERLVTASSGIGCFNMSLAQDSAMKPGRRHWSPISCQGVQMGRNLTLKQDSSHCQISVSKIVSACPFATLMEWTAKWLLCTGAELVAVPSAGDSSSL